MNDIIVTIDPGSYNTTVLIAQESIGEFPIIAGVGEANSAGISRGQIVDAEKALSGIVHALKDAEKLASLKVKKVSVVIGGDSLRGFLSHSVIAIPKSNEGKVTPNDIVKLLEIARAVKIPDDQKIIDAVVQSFTIDGQKVENPLNMVGVRLEALVKIFTMSAVTLENMVHLLNSLNLDVEYPIIAPYAAAKATLTSEEAEIGTAVLDIGADTTGIAVYNNRRMIYAGVVRFAGNSITGDIAAGLRLPRNVAEKLKINYGEALEETVPIQDTIPIPVTTGQAARTVHRRHLAEIIEPRIEEILMMAQDKLREQKLDKDLRGGIVLTGGTSLLPGIIPLTRRVFQLPVRIGFPAEDIESNELIKTPIYSAAFGALLAAIEKRERTSQSTTAHNGFLGKFIDKIRTFILQRT